MAAALSPDDYPAYAAYISNKKQKPLGWGQRPALVVVDVTEAYFSAASPLSLLASSCGTGSSAPAAVAQLVAAAHAGGCPVVWARTRLSDRADLLDAGLWKQKVSASVLGVFGEDGGHTGFLEGLAPQREQPAATGTASHNNNTALPWVADLVVDKKCASAFFGTNLATQLTVLGVDTLVFCGARTSGEIRQSVLDGQGLGYRGVVATDACADTCRETHFANLFDIRAKMADVATSEEAAQQLQKGWSWNPPSEI